jgi:type I restriction enzyme S subunit
LKINAEITTQKNNNWKKTRIGDICVVGRGSSPRPITDPKYFDGGTIPWIKIADATKSGKYLYDTKEKVNEFGASFSRLMPKGTLILAASGVSLGQTQFLGVPGCIHDGWLYLHSFNGVDEHFLYYLFKWRQQHFFNMAYGAAIQNINTTILREMEIDIPPLHTQHKIAAILSAYDDLIENNTRRIKILEEMAQALYREWFVKFRFPGHEKVKMVESELGMVPDGWEIKKATDAIYVNPTTKVPKEGEKPFVSMGNLSNDSMFVNSYEYRSGNSGSKFKNGDTLFARITPCLENGKTAYVQFLPSNNDIAFGSTEFIVLRSKTLCSELVYLMARSNEFRDNAIKSMSGATGRQRVQEACFDKYLFAHPDSKIISVFVEYVSPLLQNAYMLNKKSANLRRTRDMLLPKLISGEVDVENIEVKLTQ